MNNPQSKLWLCKTDLENDYKNTLTFSSATAQRNYFIGNPENPTDHGKSTASFTDYTYLRKENAIKVDRLVDDIDTNNYLVLINKNKYYYYFITKMSYIDDETTRIEIEMDVIQTYFFDIVYSQSFIEREHVTDDTAGKHTIPEGLETGEYIASSSGLFDLSTSPVFSDIDDWSVVMAVTPDDNIFGNITNTYYGGVFSGNIFMEFSGLNLPQAGYFIKAMNAQDKVEAITNIFMYPTIALSTTSASVNVGGFVVNFGLVNTTSSEESFSIGIMNKPTTIGSYTPRNKKLLTNDYIYLLADNGVGGTKKYNFEDFTTNNSPDIIFDYISTPTPGGSCMFAPRQYKGINGVNTLESFAGAKYPICSWNTDPYTAWLAQSEVNRSFTFGQDILGSVLGAGATAIGVATANPFLIGTGATAIGTGLTNTIGNIIEDVKQKKVHDIAPPSLVGNESLGDVLFAYQRSVPRYYVMNIKEEYAKIIDKFFDMFGYKVNTLKSPSIHTRNNWNYIKTKGCNFTGNIPQIYMDRIKSIFDNGITFWHNPATMLDYTQNNSVIS